MRHTTFLEDVYRLNVCITNTFDDVSRHLHTKSSWTASLSIWTVWVRVWRFHCRVKKFCTWCNMQLWPLLNNNVFIFTTKYEYMFVWYPARKYIIFIWRLHFISRKGQQNLCFVRRLRSLRREVSLSSHTWCDTGPRFYNLIRKTASVSKPIYDNYGVLRWSDR